MKISRRAGKKDNTHVGWYDTECRNVKKEKFKFLNLFAETGHQYFYEKFRFLRNKFKQLIQSKTKGYKTSLREQIENSVNDQKGFWTLVKKVSRNFSGLWLKRYLEIPSLAQKFHQKLGMNTFVSF